MNDNLVTLLVAVVSSGMCVCATIYITFISISKDLKYLIGNEKRELTYLQARSLAELYVFHVQSIIKLEGERFIESYFAKHISFQDIEIVEEFINTVTNKTIELAKDKFAHFGLFGGGNFSDMINLLLNDKRSITALTKKDALDLFVSCAKQGICGEELKARFQNLIRNSGEASKERIINLIRKKYHVKHG